MREIGLILFLGLAIGLNTACIRNADCTQASGAIVRQDVSISPFDRLYLYVPAQLVISKDSVSRMRVEGPENIIEELNTSVNGLNLSIGKNNCFKGQSDLRIYLSTVALKYVSLQGSGEISGEGVFASPLFEANIDGSGTLRFNLEVDQVDVSINGSGNLILSGSATQQCYHCDGSGNFLSFDLTGERADVNLDGSGNCEVNVSDYLKVRIRGSGNVFYRGNPAIDSEISGSGKVIRSN